MSRGRDSEWPEARTAKLIQLHAEGLTMGQISRRLGVSKNTVSGKVSRLGLNDDHPPLISPNDPRQERTPRVVPLRNPLITLPPLPSLLEPMVKLMVELA